MNRGVKRSNVVFGDREPDVTNVIFVNGNIDPWHALGILDNISLAAPAVMVDGAFYSVLLRQLGHWNDFGTISISIPRVRSAQ